MSPVPALEFGPQALEDRLRDANWVRDRVLAHQKVLVTLLGSYDLVPFKFCTLYVSEARVEEAMAQYYTALDKALGRVRGATEWGVKLYCDRETVAGWVQSSDEAVRSIREAIAHASQGAAYFLGKKLTSALREAVDRAVDACVQESHRRLAQCARDAVVNPVQPGQEGEVVLNAAYLVDAPAEGVFRAALQGLEEIYAPRGFRYELTGPWPPYNFAVLEAEEVARECTSSE